MTYSLLLNLHSLWRWAVLLSILFAIYRALDRYLKSAAFTKLDNAIRHWTATIAHVQLILGLILYTKSPTVAYFYEAPGTALQSANLSFFPFYHLLLMLLSIGILTVGSAITKRKASDQEKFKSMLLWFSLALLIMLIAIPWPFSPIAQRPLIPQF